VIDAPLDLIEIDARGTTGRPGGEPAIENRSSREALVAHAATARFV
jgi:hypothetical protein